MRFKYYYFYLPFLPLPFLLPVLLIHIRPFVTTSSPTSSISPITAFYNELPPLPPPAPISVRSVRLLKAPTFPGSLGESIRIHQPLVINPPDVSTPSSSIRCTDYSLEHDLQQPKCLSYLKMQDFSPTPLGYTNMTYAQEPGICSQTTALFMVLNFRDINVCHTMMRMLLGWHVVRNTERYGIPPVSTLILISPEDFVTRAMTPSSARDGFHVGLLKQLFIKEGVSIVTVNKFEKLKPFCVNAGVILGSFANRFAFTDLELQNGTRAGLSSDALSLRNHVFANAPQPMRRRLLYVSRGQSRKRVFTRESEDKFRSMLARVASDFRFELQIFEGDKSGAMSFEQQISYFSESAVVVGLHGAGLSLAAFMPKGGGVVEIEPSDHWLPLFGNLRMFGISYRVVVVSGKAEACELGDDLAKVEGEVRQAVREVVETNFRAPSEE